MKIGIGFSLASYQEYEYSSRIPVQFVPLQVHMYSTTVLIASWLASS